jgi:hypothetical protein
MEKLKAKYASHLSTPPDYGGELSINPAALN